MYKKCLNLQHLHRTCDTINPKRTVFVKSHLNLESSVLVETIDTHLCCLLFCKTVDASQGFPLLKVIWFVFTAPDLRNTQLLMSVVALWYDRLTQLTPNNHTNLQSRFWCKLHHVVHVSCRVHAWCAASQPCCCYYGWSGMHTWQPFNFYKLFG